MIRLSLWYAMAVGAIGMLPFLAPTLEQAGFSGSQTAQILLAIPVASLFGGPLSAWIADQTGHHHQWIRWALFCAGSLALWMCFARGPALLLAVLLFAIVRTPVFPLADAATVHALGDRYGPVRAVGSVGYAAVVLVSGAVRDHTPSAPLWIAGTLLLGAGLLAGTLPPLERERGAPPFRSLLAHLSSRRTSLVLLVALLNGLSMCIYDHLFTLSMDARGVPAMITGVAVAWGVLVEVAVLFMGPYLLRRIGARALFMLSAGSGVPRFLGTAWFDDPWVIAALQGLHGLQFGAFWVAGLAWVSKTAPPDLRRSSQAAFAATGFGLAPILGLSLASWWLGFAELRILFGLLVLPAVLATIVAAWIPQQELR